jgi:hypothetical protein
MSYSNGPRIVNDGLVLYLDAGNSKSYPGTGTIWNDLSGRNNNGTIENSPTYNIANKGAFTFNGTTQRVNCGNSSSLQITSGSIGAWFNADSNNSGFRGIIAKQNAWALFVASNTLVTYSWDAPVGTKSTNITVGNNTWNYAVMTFTETTGAPSNNAIVYLNGSPVLTTTIKHSNHSVSVYVGEANSNQYFSGKISNASIYNRVLSPTEILQNYNATKGRFGL